MFLTKIASEPEKVTKLVLAAFALHNMWRDNIGITSGMADHENPDTHNMTTGSWREGKVLEQATLPAGTNSPCEITTRVLGQVRVL